MNTRFSFFLIIWALGAFAWQQPAHGDTGDQPAGQLYDIGDHKLYAQVHGTGSVTFVLEMGLGSSLDSWDPFLAEVASRGKVVAYERAGVGQSEPGPLPRDPKQVAKELHLLLQTMELEPPFILVGHSLGGLHCRMFAQLYPDQVSGLILIDPQPEMIIERQNLSDEILEQVEAGNASWLSSSPQIIQDEMKGGKLGEEYINESKLPEVPVVVISSIPAVLDVPDEERAMWENALRIKKLIHSEIMVGISQIITPVLLAETHATKCARD